ncbi:MAG: hypothetical protein IJ125_07600 [Atopobiaceae bacterium]|nr:hypothetical protein [Atopobiaceae bacterium]
MSKSGKSHAPLIGALLFVAAAAAFFVLAQMGVLDGLLGRNTQPQVPEQSISEPSEPEPQSIDDYSWAELSELSAKIAAAPTADEAIKIAADAHLVNPDGTLTGEVKRIELTDGTIAGFMISDLWHDEKSDGSGHTGLSFVSDSAIALAPMNASGAITGGWEGSELRAWLATEGMKLLPEDMANALVEVTKLTNNVGHGATADSITPTNDKLWLYSAVEVCGPLNWYGQEYGGQWAYLDDVANKEGFQYRLFAEQGVVSKSDPSGSLVRRYHGQKVSWWYRTTSIGVEQIYIGGNAGDFFYDVLDSGYPYGQGQPAEVQGVVVGFCL